MKIVYIGSMSGCYLEGTIWMVRGEPTEVPEALAKKVLEEQKENFKKPETARRRAQEG